MAGMGISISRLRELRDLFEKQLKTASGKAAWKAAARPTRLDRRDGGHVLSIAGGSTSRNKLFQRQQC